MTTTIAATRLASPLLAPSVDKAKQVVLSELPQAWPRLEACFATSAAIRLQNLDLCPTLMLTGPSGALKSFTIDALSGAVGTVRVDSINAASFVSSASNLTGKQLQQKDLLPTIRHQTMLTRDLSTVFRKNTDQLRDLFGILIPVLDGTGYAPSSGTQGLRSITGNYVFCWIAATTPFPPQTWDTQKRFGSRLLHYDVFGTSMTDEQILAERSGKPLSKKLEECKAAAAVVLAVIHLKRADGISKPAPLSVPWADDPLEINLWRVKLGRLLVACRRMQGNIEEDEEDNPHRVITQLEALTRGRAMLEDRTVVTVEDLPLAVHTVLSSSRHGRVLRAVAENPNGLTAKACAALLSCSEQTAENRMKAFVKRTGERVVKWDDPSTENFLVPSQDFSWVGDLKGLGWL